MELCLCVMVVDRRIRVTGFVVIVVRRLGFCILFLLFFGYFCCVIRFFRVVVRGWGLGLRVLFLLCVWFFILRCGFFGVFGCG